MHANESKPITQIDNGVSQCTPSRKRHSISYQPKYHQYHSFIHRFSPEIFRKIIDHAVFEQPCLKHVYNKCFDSWSCKEGSHPDPKLPYVVIPSPYITSQCRIIYKEAYESFYKNSLLIFSTSKDPAAVPYEDGRIDPRATRLLDFTTSPEWKNTGSLCFRKFLSDAAYASIDQYRHNIRHLAFKVDRLGGDNH